MCAYRKDIGSSGLPFATDASHASWQYVCEVLEQSERPHRSQDRCGLERFHLAEEPETEDGYHDMCEDACA
eukprot:3874037-Heterocapsa_arctica.AAC.1